MDFLLQLINITLLNMEISWQLKELNTIVMAAENTTNISTIAIFGDAYDIEEYIRLSEGNTVPKLVITRNYGDINFSYDSGFNRKMFFVGLGYLEHKAMWNHLNNAFLGIQGHVRGAFVTKRSKRKNARLILREHFEWCWRKGITNALILVDNEKFYEKKFQIFNYNHFLSQRVLNITSFNEEDLYPDKFRNLNQFKIRTLAQFDPPRVFEKLNCIGKYKQPLLGYVATLFQAFVKEYNAKMDLQYLPINKTLNIGEIIGKLDNDEIDLVINPYTPYKNIHLSYPLRMVQRCIVVPYPELLPKFKFFILPFETKVWLSFLATWLILSLAKLFGAFIKKLNNSNLVYLDIGQNFLEVWRLMIYLPSPSTSFNTQKWFNGLWFIFIATMGFIFSNLYMASLTSYFSGLIFNPTIDTLSELIQRQIFINIVDTEIPSILNNRYLPKDFVDLLIPRHTPDLVQEILDLRDQHTYSAPDDRIQFALNQQIHLLRPICQMVRECLTTMPFGFIMPAHSQYELSLNRFILRSASAGLIDKWILDSIQDGYCSGILSMRMPKLKIYAPLALDHFQFGWFVLAGGYMVAVVVFLLENLKRILKRFKIFLIYY